MKDYTDTASLITQTLEQIDDAFAGLGEKPDVRNVRASLMRAYGFAIQALERLEVRA